MQYLTVFVQKNLCQKGQVWVQVFQSPFLSDVQQPRIISSSLHDFLCHCWRALRPGPQALTRRGTNHFVLPGNSNLLQWTNNFFAEHAKWTNFRRRPATICSKWFSINSDLFSLFQSTYLLSWASKPLSPLKIFYPRDPLPHLPADLQNRNFCSETCTFL